MKMERWMQCKAKSKRRWGFRELSLGRQEGMNSPLKQAEGSRAL